MSMRQMVITSALGLAFAGPPAAQAALQGHLYTNASHQLAVTRPDASWELRENIPLPSAVCAFVVDDGTAAAILAHQKLSGDQILRDADDLRNNRAALNDLIAGSVFRETGNLEYRSSDYHEAGGRIAFDLFINNREPERGPLENHIVGFIVRDQNNTQHLYAIRCAATKGSFLLWESQFDRIVPTLTFTGAAVSPVYRSRPIPVWWWVGGGVLVLILLLALRGRGRSGPAALTRVPHRVQRPDAAPAPITPVDIVDDSGSAYSDVPDFLRRADGENTVGPGDTQADAVTEPHHGAATGVYPELAETTVPASGVSYWTCICGRKNAGVDSFCSRCNTDRPRA